MKSHRYNRFRFYAELPKNPKGRQVQSLEWMCLITFQNFGNDEGTTMLASETQLGKYCTVVRIKIPTLIIFSPHFYMGKEY